MAFCTYCGKSFQRNEHLERHLATHTNIKRFKCSICHISFSRGDVLQKHLAIHGDVDADSPPGVVRVRARTQTACRNCAKMKAKCDSNSPCNRCRSKKLTCDRQSKRARAAAVSDQSQHIRVDGDGESPELASNRENDDLNEPGTRNQDGHSVGHPEPRYEAEPQPQPQPQKELGIFINNRSLMDCATESVSGQNNLVASGTDLAQNVPPLVEWPAADGCQQIDASSLSHFVPENPTSDVTTGVQDFIGGQSDPASINLQVSPQNSHDGGWDSSIQPMASALEHPAVLEGRDYWSCFRCNPTKDPITCPRTAGIFLESLSQMPKYDRLWSWFDLDFSGPAFTEKIVSMPVLENTRDTLSAISQSFLQKALEVHKLDPAAASVDAASPSSDVSRGFLVLPPSATLDYFLGEYMRLFEPFYKLIPAGVLDANFLLGGSNNRAGTLLILLMIAQAASSDPTTEGRRLSAGLTEVCRISLFDLIEKDVSTCHHSLPVHSALLFITQAVWSGDKWLMDIGSGQRGIYIAMVRSGGLFDIRDNYPDSGGDWELTRSRWLERERIIRLAYAWVLLDLEMSLYQDTNLHIPVLAMNSSLPSSEELWLAPDVATWQQLLTRDDDSGVGSYSTQPLPQPSLRALFTWFLNDDLTLRKQQYLNPLTLRLLLHPLHGLVYSCRQLLDCLGEMACSRSFSPITKASTHVRMHEIRSLLNRWLNLYKLSLSGSWGSTTAGGNETSNELVTATLITYHIINLNTVASIPDIEELARRELSDQELRLFSQEASSFVHSPKEAVFHAGRILHLLRTLDRKTRPPWWPAALYRSTLCLWVCSIFYGPLWTSSSSSSYLLVDAQEGDSLDPYSWNLVRGTSKDDFVGAPWDSRSPSLVPALKNPIGTGEPVTLEHPSLVLETCLLVFDTGVATRVCEGIRGKLNQLLRRRNALNSK
ncbi:uncharacterized protein F4807DRAFT_387682 [Annulohypoxylon truncatum]|uniref:uncharacterized protein n=1 Tax=Annulohypoxylon truncatum TaxID=327061 RepID=UPI0020086761|nr:uncharacterized protein F4807DRAFT_387682 [Annulohypoxylon truncatum]KAI1212098.1 hypothetical protein F4807DRAFT_387682 [Annulohypoxylon truncatum]